MGEIICGVLNFGRILKTAPVAIASITPADRTNIDIERLTIGVSFT